MTVDETGPGRREAELAWLAQQGTAEAILIAHQRRDLGSCLCGWAELGKLHAGHQVAMLREAALLKDPPVGGS